MSDEPIIIAHRGGYGSGELENTLKSFRKAIELRVDMIEFDVRRTKDDYLIAFHDGTVNEMEVSSLTYSELKSVTGRSNIPQLEQVLKLAKGKIELDIELKETGYESEVVKILNYYLKPNEFMIKSFHDGSVKLIKELYPKIKAGLLLGVDKANNKITTRVTELFPIKRLQRCKADFVSPNYRLLKLFFIKRMKKNGFEIYVWTVNDEKQMKRLKNKGIDGIITDNPEMAQSIY